MRHPQRVCAMIASRHTPTTDAALRKGYLMIESAKVENFRCFESLELRGLRRVNILTGDNGSGKTALLEAIKLGLDGTPNLPFWFNQNRNTPSAMPVNPTADQFKALFEDLFYNLDTSKKIQVSTQDSNQRSANVAVFFDPRRAVTTQPARLPGSSPVGFRGVPSRTLPLVPNTVVPLVFERSNFDGKRSSPRIRIDNAGNIKAEPATHLGIVSSLFTATNTGNAFENATWLSGLSVQKKSDEVIDAVRKLFPRIQGLSAESVILGLPQVYADVIHLPKKIPLSAVSSGIGRVFTFVLAIITFRTGAVLLDEIENGMFYTHYERVWRTLVDLARQYDTQLFISTHSGECLKSVAPLIAEAPTEFCLLRAKYDKDHSEIETFGGAQLEAALKDEIEVR